MSAKFDTISFLLSAFLFVQPVQAQEPSPTQQETASVTSTVSRFYQAILKERDYRKLDTDLFSEELNALLQLAKAVENRSAKEVAASDRPTDKPYMFEGAIFAPLYEGFSRVIAIENVRKTKTDWLADVRLSYDSVPPLAWTDTAVVVLENGRWKIDNVLFHKNESFEEGSAKRSLRAFGTGCCN